ncbi:galactose mutarotase-like protein [Thozetella sp. PMI_491]|nr:galactose mutarotase-like protein [Thozetella sp. PMI_491]
MVDRPNKPAALASTPGLPAQAQVSISHANSRVSAVLPTGESVEVLLHGATVLSWKDKDGNEKLWVSEGAKLDGSKAVRGGIPVVFPVFGTAPDHPQTGKLAQHGVARVSNWEFLGKSTSESTPDAAGADLSVKLDFGLSAANVDDSLRALWPYKFGLIYSVTLNQNSLTTSLVATNDDDKPFDIQVLFHTYLRVNEISNVEVHGLDGSEYLDKVGPLTTKKQSAAVTFSGEVDRVYTPVGGPSTPVTVVEDGKTKYTVLRDNLNDVTVWNPWTEKANSIGDFAPKDGFHKMVCIEPGAVRGWQTLEPGDAFEGAQTIVAS